MHQVEGDGDKPSIGGSKDFWPEIRQETWTHRANSVTAAALESERAELRSAFLWRRLFLSLSLGSEYQRAPAAFDFTVVAHLNDCCLWLIIIQSLIIDFGVFIWKIIGKWTVSHENTLMWWRASDKQKRLSSSSLFLNERCVVSLGLKLMSQWVLHASLEKWFNN